jgi:hypothetical protein
MGNRGRSRKNASVKFRELLNIYLTSLWGFIVLPAMLFSILLISNHVIHAVDNSFPLHETRYLWYIAYSMHIFNYVVRGR